MNLLKALATVSSMTFVSRIPGFVRDVLIATLFGAGLATDAFFVAFRIPNLLRRLFAEGAFSQAFVPVLSEYRTRRGDTETKLLVDRTATLLTLALLAATALGVAAATIVVYVSAPGFAATPAKFDLTVAMLRITFPYILFISLVSLAGGILNTWSRFAIPALTPALLNLSFIFAALFFAPYFDPPVMVLAWAVFVGGVLQLGFQIPALAKIGMLPRPRLSFSDPGVRRILVLMAPAAFGVSLGLILVKILAPGFYARQNIGTPVRIAIVTLIATQLMNAALIIPLKHAGLALAIGLGACLNAGLLYRQLRRHGIYQPQPGWGAFVLKVAAALAAMALALWLAMGPVPWWLAPSRATRAVAVTRLLLLGGAACIARPLLLRL